MVEFAIVLPVLILIILGILYFGRYENYSNQETQMAEQGARQAAVNVNPGTPTGLQRFIINQASGELQNGSGDVSSSATVYIYYPTGSTGAVGQPVRACVVATAQLPFLGTSIKIVQSAEMRVEVARTAAVWTNDATATASTAGCPTSS